MEAVASYSCQWFGDEMPCPVDVYVILSQEDKSTERWLFGEGHCIFKEYERPYETSKESKGEAVFLRDG